MKLLTAILTTFSMVQPVYGTCKPKGTSITEGGFWDLGVNGTWDPYRYNADNVNVQDHTWTVPTGTWSYPQGEIGNRGANVRTQYTCTTLKFCNPEDSMDLVQDVYVFPDKASFDSCDFGNAQLVDETGPNGKCVEVTVDDSTDLKMIYYANKDNCEKGQKVVVNLADWESTKNQCAAIADNIPASSRIRGCDCDFQKKPFSGSYNELCAYAYREKCMAIEQKGDDCCEKNTCWSTSELWAHENGKSKELKRRESCDNDIPGMCYNMNGLATDVNGLGSTDCCSHQCQKCGTELGDGVKWVKCTANNPAEMTATCGSLTRYSGPFECDFSKCPDDSTWSPKADAIRKYMGTPLNPTLAPVASPAAAPVETPTSFASFPSNYFALLSMIFPFLF